MEDYKKLYSEMHKNDKYFPGYTLKKHADKVAELVKRTNPARLLDYGSGKGYQYLKLRLHERWGGLLPYCYDVGVRQLSERPEGRFDGIICTDVMEHIAEKDVDAILGEVFSFSNVDWVQQAFVFFSISCAPAYRKTLPDGRNVHLTVRPPVWWNGKIIPFHRKGLIVEVAYDVE